MKQWEQEKTQSQQLPAVAVRGCNKDFCFKFPKIGRSTQSVSYKVACVKTCDSRSWEKLHYSELKLELTGPSWVFFTMLLIKSWRLHQTLTSCVKETFPSHPWLQAIKIVLTTEWIMLGYSFTWQRRWTTLIFHSRLSGWLFAGTLNSEPLNAFILSAALCLLQTELPSCPYNAAHFNNWHVFFYWPISFHRGPVLIPFNKAWLQITLIPALQGFLAITLVGCFFSDSINGKTLNNIPVLYLFRAQVRGINSVVFFFFFCLLKVSFWVILSGFTSLNLPFHKHFWLKKALLFSLFLPFFLTEN